MWTKADFYLGRGASAEWIGSLSSDGYPSGCLDVVRATTKREFECAIRRLSKLGGFAWPEDGWPHTWKTSHLTDWSYTWDRRQLWISCFGCEWLPARLVKPASFTHGRIDAGVDRAYSQMLGASYEDLEPQLPKRAFPRMKWNGRLFVGMLVCQGPW